MSFFNQLQKAARILPDKVVLYDGETSITYEEFYRQVCSIIKYLNSNGFSRNSRCGIISKNSVAVAEMIFVCSAMDCIFVPINYNYSFSDIVSSTQTAGLNVLFVGEELESIVSPLSSKLFPTKVLPLRALKDAIDSDFTLNESSVLRLLPPKNIKNARIALFSSGRTGPMKCCVYPEETISKLINYNQEMDLVTDDCKDRVVMHCIHNAYLLSIFSFIRTVNEGLSLIVLSNCSPQIWFDTVEKFGVTHCVMTSSMLIDLLHAEDMSERNVDSLRNIYYGVDLISLHDVLESMSRFPKVSFRKLFFISETMQTISALIYSRSQYPVESLNDPSVRSYLESMGKVTSDVSVKICDESAQPLPTRQIGRIWIRSDYSIMGFLENHGQFVPFKNDWINTDDLGYMNSSSGYLTAIGFNISPLTNSKYEMGKRVFVYPEICNMKKSDRNIPQLNASLYFNNINQYYADTFALNEFFRMCNNLHMCTTKQALEDEYFSSINSIIYADSYGIWFNDPSSNFSRSGGELKWVTADFNEINGLPSSWIHSRTKDGRVLKQSVIFPRYSPSKELLCAIAFMRYSGNDFDYYEHYIMSVIVDNLTIAWKNLSQMQKYERAADISTELIDSFDLGHVTFDPKTGNIIRVNNIVKHLFENEDTTYSGSCFREHLKNISSLAFSGSQVPEDMLSYKYFEKNSPNAQLLFIKISDSKYSNGKLLLIYGYSHPSTFNKEKEILSRREFEIFNLIIGGKSTMEISNTLNISANTTKSHLKNIYEKLGVSSKIELMSKYTK